MRLPPEQSGKHDDRAPWGRLPHPPTLPRPAQRPLTQRPPPLPPTRTDAIRLAGDYGFDPLGLGKDPTSLRWYQQAELVHARTAMTAVAGILIPSVSHTCQHQPDGMPHAGWQPTGMRP